MKDFEIKATLNALWRIESARIIAVLTRMVGDIELAEYLAQDAWVIALEKWPQSGVTPKPFVRLISTAKHRAIDRLRRAATLQSKHEQLGHELETQGTSPEVEFDAASERMPCRLPSLPAMHVPAPRRRQIGCASLPSTMPSPRWHPPPWSS